MKIALLGNHTVDHCSEVHWAHTLRQLGHEVLQLQENAMEPPHIVDLASLCDLLIYVRCWGWDPVLNVDDLDRLELANTRTMGLHLDRFSDLERWHTLVQGRHRDPMFDCELVCTADGDAPWADVDVNHHWLKAGVYRPECYDARKVADITEDIDVAFVGSWRGYHGEWPHRQEMVKRLVQRYGSRFQCFPVQGEPAVRGAALNELYARAAVVVGDSIFARRGAHYWSDRFYETWGRGGFLIFPRIAALQREMGEAITGQPGYLYDYPSWNVGDWDELYRCIDSYLEAPQARERERDRIGRAVREHCTYYERLAEALTVLAETPRR